MNAQAGIDYAAATDQSGLVLSILQSGRSLTREEALQKFHIWNLPTRVCELRKAGYNIQSENVDCGGVRPVARYYLGDPVPFLRPKLDGIPDELKALPQWVAWSWDMTRTNAEGKPGKRLFCVHDPERHASSTDPSTWSSFKGAWAVYEAGKAHGVAFCMTESDPYVFIDMDGCLNDGGRGVIPKCRALVNDAVREFCTYTERSVSGRGLHILFRVTNKAPFLKGQRWDGVEMYGRHFMTVTGRSFRKPRPIAERQGMAEAFKSFLFDELRHAAAAPADGHCARSAFAQTPHDDDEVLKEMLERDVDGGKRPRGEDRRALFSGGWQGMYSSQSEADLALCGVLACYTSDAGQMDRLFRRSGLYRGKWEREDYRRRTLQLAMSGEQSHA